MKEISYLKKIAAEFAVNEFVDSNMIIGLGTGSTAIFTLHKIAELIKQGNFKNIKGIPSSEKTKREAMKLHIPITSFNKHKTIDLTIDGADEVDPDMNLIKGGGGALLREKILAQASNTVVIIVDESKISETLGTNWPVPIEVIPFGWESHLAFLESIGSNSKLRLSESGNPFVTDQGNFIIDLYFGPITNLISLSEMLNSRAGIIEHGLFIDMATDLVVASDQGVKHTKKE